MSYHIQDVLKSVQEAAPAPHTTTDDIIARARRSRTRRTAATVAGSAVAGIAAVTVAVSAAATSGASSSGFGAAGQPSGSAPAQPAVSAPAPQVSAPAPLPVKRIDFVTTLTGYRTGVYHAGPPGLVTAGFQELPVYRDGETWPGDDGVKYPLATGTITAYRAKLYKPESFAFDESATQKPGKQYPITVEGRPGFGIDLTYISPADGTKKWVKTALAWEYADNAWATFVPRDGQGAVSRADALKIAGGLTLGAKREVKAPYRFGYLPEGWQVVGAEQTDADTSNRVSTVYLHQGPMADPVTRVDELPPRTIKIEVSKGKPKNASLAGKDGVHCYTGRANCVIVRGDHLIDVVDLDGALGNAQVEQLTRGLQPADPAAQGTWMKIDK
ncbi:hypothetical protein Asp14428_63940 [Actinoplanes sp. NBRC 14428]|nr:hypothetical protein Asp14428_63940 [Actinoplanes sp. NBRC 14428]